MDGQGLMGGQAGARRPKRRWTPPGDHRVVGPVGVVRGSC